MDASESKIYGRLKIHFLTLFIFVRRLRTEGGAEEINNAQSGWVLTRSRTGYMHEIVRGRSTFISNTSATLILKAFDYGCDIRHLSDSLEILESIR